MSASSAATAAIRESTDVRWDVESVIVASAKAIGVSDLPIPTGIDRDGTYMILAAPPRRLVPEPLQATEVTGPSRLQALYVPHFLRLEQALKALEKSAIVPAGEGIVARSVPGSVTNGLEQALKALEKSETAPAGEGIVARFVTDGRVAGLDVVAVEAEGKLVFGSELGKHEARPTK